MVVLDTDGLAKQDKEALDLKTLAADTPEVISRQVIIIYKLFYGFLHDSVGYFKVFYNKSSYYVIKKSCSASLNRSIQATINIGTIGHVAHGKSTVVKAISGTLIKIFFQNFFLEILLPVFFYRKSVFIGEKANLQFDTRTS